MAVAAGAGFDRRLTLPLVLGSMLNPVNSSMIAVALIPIGLAFGAPPAQTAWLVSALYLATAVGQPVVGRLVDTYGPRPLYLAGTGLVGVAGVLGALAPSLPVLVVARVLLGFGTCAAYPAAMYLIRRTSGTDGPGGILTALAVSAQTMSIVGPALGGLLIDVGGWRAIFTVNLPLAAACLILGGMRLPRTMSLAKQSTKADLPGMALFAAMLLALMLFLMGPRADRSYLPVAAVAAGAALALRELRVPAPFIDLRLLAGNLPLLATFLRQVLNFTAAYAFIYGFTQWLEEGRGLSPSAAGLLLLPMAVTAVLTATVSGRWPELRGKLLVGGASMAVACLLLLAVRSDSPIWLLGGIGVLVGLPQGLNGLANQNALYRQADADRMGSAAGLLRTFMYLGAIAASAAVAGFFGRGASTPGLHHLSLFMVGCAAALVAVTLPDRSLSPSGKADPMTVTTLDDRAALVVIDLQNGVVGLPTEPYPGAEVVARARELADAFRAHGSPVVLVRVTAAPDGADATPGRTEVSRPNGARPAGWDVIVEDLAGHPDDITVTKRNWSAFYGTDLDLQLRRRGVTQIVLAGIATSIGVESTARAAHERGYHVTLATDAMADASLAAHENSVERIFPRLGERGTTAEILDLLARR